MSDDENTKSIGHDPASAEDYLAQLKWHSLRRRSRPEWASDEPRWKYKITYTKTKTSSWVSRAILVGIIVVLTGYLLYQVIALRSGLAIFLSAVFLLILIILVFAIRDARTRTNKDPDFNSEQKQE
jgi:hypothetical protein